MQWTAYLMRRSSIVVEWWERRGAEKRGLKRRDPQKQTPTRLQKTNADQAKHKLEFEKDFKPQKKDEIQKVFQLLCSVIF